jgi:hypothetical protein
MGLLPRAMYAFLKTLSHRASGLLFQLGADNRK